MWSIQCENYVYKKQYENEFVEFMWVAQVTPEWVRDPGVTWATLPVAKLEDSSQKINLF